jgi:hypothetical protein
MSKCLLGLLLVVFIIPSIASASGTAYTDMFGTTHYSDGSTSSTDIYGTTHYSNGWTADTGIYGTTTYHDNKGNSGTSNTGIYGTTYYNFNNGISGVVNPGIYGTATYHDNKGNSGTSSTDIYGTTTYNGNIFNTHSCPSNSSYDSLLSKCKCSYGYVVGSSGQCTSASLVCSAQIGVMSRYNSLSNKCECMAGYEYNGSSCVYKKINYPTLSTYSPPSLTKNNCPLNSHASTTDSTKCSCDSGYQTNSLKTACVIATLIKSVGTSTKTNSQICARDIPNSYWDGKYNSNGGLECPCNNGYAPGSDSKSCLSLKTASSVLGCTSLFGFSPTTGVSCNSKK